MRYYTPILLLFVFLFSCQDDNNDFPKTYTFSHYDKGDRALFVIDQNGAPEVIQNLVGSFQRIQATELDTILDQSMELVFVEELILLSETELNLKMRLNQIALDTMLTYDMTGTEFMIVETAFDGILDYNGMDGVFEVCNQLIFSKPGPNPISAAQAYRNDFSECQSETVQEELNKLTDQFDYATGDSIGIFFPKMVYRRN